MSKLEIIFNIFIAAIFLVSWGLAFVILYHLTRFGIGVQPKRLAAIFLFGLFIISATAIILFTSVDIGTLVPQ